MNENAHKMLEALRGSANEATREHAIDVLEGRPIPFDSQGLGAVKLAATGNLGGFLQVVTTGNFREAWLKADILNRHALRTVVPIEDQVGIDLDNW